MKCWAAGCDENATRGNYCGIHVDAGDEIAAVIRDLDETAPRWCRAIARKEGSKVQTGKPKWTLEAALDAIREVGANVGRTPSYADMNAAGYSTVAATPTLARLGMSWAELVSEAGFEPRAWGRKPGDAA